MIRGQEASVFTGSRAWRHPEQARAILYNKRGTLYCSQLECRPHHDRTIYESLGVDGFDVNLIQDSSAANSGPQQRAMTMRAA